MKAVVPDLKAIKGQFLRNTRDSKIYRVTAVGIAGVTAYEVDEKGHNIGPENTITWRAVKAVYSILVAVEDIDDGKIVHPSSRHFP